MRVLAIGVSLVAAFLQGCSTYSSQLEQARRDYIDDKISQEEYSAKVDELTRKKAKSDQVLGAVAAALAGAGQGMSQQATSASYPTNIPSVNPAQPALSQSLYWLEGASIVANDGKFLGKITTNSLASDSIGNQIGQYGSSISSVSIFNNIGQYGSTISSLSPWNTISSTPPKIITSDGQRWAYLSVNQILSPRIDPYLVVAYVHSR